MFKSEKTSSLEESGDNTPTLIVVGAVENILSEFADVKNHNSSGLTSKLSPLCLQLKRVGREMEADHKDKLDLLQSYFVEVCRDPSVDVNIRLSVLEILELRSCGWETNPHIEHFYRERSGEIQRRQEAKKQAIAEAFAPTSKKPARAANFEGDNLKFQTKVSDLFPNSQVRSRKSIVVDVKGKQVKLFLSSTNQALLTEAKICLSQHFCRRSSVQLQNKNQK